MTISVQKHKVNNVPPDEQNSTEKDPNVAVRGSDSGGSEERSTLR